MFIAKDPLWQLRFAKFFIIALGKEFYKDFLQDQFGLRKKKKNPCSKRSAQSSRELLTKITLSLR
jgi:hypothetical protein